MTKNKTLKHLNIVKPYDKPEHILNIIIDKLGSGIQNIWLFLNHTYRSRDTEHAQNILAFNVG